MGIWGDAIPVIVTGKNLKKLYRLSYMLSLWEL